MATLSASDARIPPDAFNRVAYQGERIRVVRRGGAVVAIISEEDLALLEELEDRYWTETADWVIADMEAKGQKPVPLEDVKAKLGL